MQVPFNDTKRQYLTLAEELDEAARRVLSSGWYIHGSELDRFESDFAEYCGRRSALCVGNGTDALEIGLRALGCGPGDEVVTIANAGMYTTTACLQVGATPVFADIDDQSVHIAPESLERVLGPRTKAVVVTHLYGKLANVAAIRDVVSGRDIAIMEDCAQAHGAELDGKRAGAFGDLAAFSFYPTKNLGALGDGGALVTDDPDLAKRISRLRQYGWVARFRSEVPYGRNSRMDEIQAAFLRVKLPHLDAWNARRREIVSSYTEASQGTGLRIVHSATSDHAAHLCIARHADRDAVRSTLETAGIATGIHYPVADHEQPALADVPTRQDGSLPVTQQVQQEILTLPCYAEMTDQEVAYVCEALRGLD